MQILDMRKLSSEWRARFAQRPLRAERARPPSWPVKLGIGLIATSATLAALVRGVVSSAPVLGLGFGVAFVAMAWIRRASRHAGATPPCGRFLYPWGYAEVDLDRAFVVLGAEMDPPELRVRDRAGAGASQVELTLRSGDWSTTFGWIGSEDEVSRRDLESLVPEGREPGHGGYRDHAARLDRRRTAPLGWRGRALPFSLAFAVGMLVGEGCVAIPFWSGELTGDEGTAGLAAWRDLESRAWAPWTVAVARHGRALRLEDQRASLRHQSENADVVRVLDAALVRSGGSVGLDTSGVRPCTPTAEEARGIDAYVASRAGLDRIATLAPDDFRSDRGAGPIGWVLDELIRAARTDHEPGVTLRVSLRCRFEPVDVVRAAGIVVAMIDTSVDWSLELEGGPVARGTLVEPRWPSSTGPERDAADPYSDWHAGVRARLPHELSRAWRAREPAALGDARAR